MIQKLDINQTPDITSQNISKIKALFPEVITETKNEQGEMVQAIDFELLKQKLATDIVDGSDERYRLDWPGKRASLLKANTPIRKTLRPVRKESVDFDTTENLFIEGDNFEALKILQESYLGKVKMIYIDPPYNTGKDFVYSDNFTQDKAEYEEEIEAVDEEGNKMFRENTRTNPRFHSDWLSMMYERLIIARDLLREDGVIFISIDDNEVHNLRKVCDEIFGESNFIAQIARKRRDSQANLSKDISPVHEHIMTYKRSESASLRRLTPDLNENDFSNPDKDERGPYVTMPCSNKGGSRYKIVTPTGVEHEDDWRFKKDTYDQLYSDNRLVFPRNGDGKPRYKLFLSEKKETGVIANTWWDDVATNQEGTNQLKAFFEDKNLFDNPKPVGLIYRILELSTEKDSIILDFFSGSATTAHAVMAQNAEDGGNRKFIMVQLAEETPSDSEASKAGYKTIAELGRERIRRAATKIKTDYAEQLAKRATPLDTGFRTYKVADTIYNDVAMYPHDLKQESLLSFADNIKAEKSPEDILTAVMLHLGLTLDLPIAAKTIGKNTIFNVADGALVACFDTDMDFAVVGEMADMKPLRAVFRDASFASDQDRINLETTFKQRSPETRVSVI